MKKRIAKQAWIECPKNQRNEFRKTAYWALKRTVKDLDLYKNNERLRLIGSDEISCLDHYHLGWYFVEAENGNPEHYRIDFSTGGPSDHLKVYRDKMLYVYQDWFVGIAYDVTANPVFQWLKNYYRFFKTQNLKSW
jgi:hypothetical protein